MSLCKFGEGHMERKHMWGVSSYTNCIWVEGKLAPKEKVTAQGKLRGTINFFFAVKWLLPGKDKKKRGAGRGRSWREGGREATEKSRGGKCWRMGSGTWATHTTCQQGSGEKANNFSIPDFSPQFNNNKKVKAACLLLPRDRARGVYFAPSLQSSLL